MTYIKIKITMLQIKYRTTSFRILLSKFPDNTYFPIFLWKPLMTSESILTRSVLINTDRVNIDFAGYFHEFFEIMKKYRKLVLKKSVQFVSILSLGIQYWLCHSKHSQRHLFKHIARACFEGLPTLSTWFGKAELY